ncbi:tetratricopeptide repeat protein [Calditrichota bacterium]
MYKNYSFPVVFLLILLIISFGCAKSDKNSNESNEAEQSQLISIDYEISRLENLLKSHSPHAPVALKLGNLYAEKGNDQKAAEYFRKYLDLDTTRQAQDVRLDLAKSLFNTGRMIEAKSELNRLLEIDSIHPGALYNLGAMEGNLGNMQAAEKYWTRLIETNPQDSLSRLAGKFIKQKMSASKELE